MIISRKIMMEVLPYLNIPQTEEITDELLQELELTREDVENGRNAALIKEKSETTETDEYGNVISSGTTAETDEYGNVIPPERHPAVYPLRQAQPMLRHHRRMLMEM